jgi:hypothetical protein
VLNSYFCITWCDTNLISYKRGIILGNPYFKWSFSTLRSKPSKRSKSFGRSQSQIVNIKINSFTYQVKILGYNHLARSVITGSFFHVCIPAQFWSAEYSCTVLLGFNDPLCECLLLTTLKTSLANSYVMLASH